MQLITIITPTYNRKIELNRLYASLRSQTDYNFEWLIIDDGSTDNTKEEVKKYKEDLFKINYFYKQNGGKHTALNLAFKKIKTELAIIVDSDDYLTNDAIKRISTDWQKYKSNSSICGLCYLKKKVDNTIISDLFENQEYIANYNDYIINKGIIGDKAEVFKSNILCKHLFPEFKNEKFVGEGVIWSKISHDYEMVFINYPIYICEYLDMGLTKSGRKLRINNPRGGMYHSEEYLSKRYSFKIREKNALLYLVYARFNNNNVLNISLKSENTLLLLLNIIPSYIIYILWKIKYKK